MANLYAEVKYKNGQTDIISNCDSGTEYLDEIYLNSKEDIEEFTVSSKCDRSYKFTCSNDSVSFYPQGDVFKFDTDFYYGGSGGFDLEPVCKKLIFTENVTYVDLYWITLPTSDDIEFVFKSKTPPKFFNGNSTYGPKIKIFNENNLKAIYVPEESVAAYASTEGFFQDYAKLIQPIEDEPDEPDVPTVKTINKIQISGETYNIGGGGGSSNIVSISQQDYDDLSTKDDDTLYVINDAEEVDLSSFATKDELKTKQDKMTNNYLSKVDVGGSSISIETKSFNGEIVQKTDIINFKTINGNPIFGMGDIKIDTSNFVTNDKFNSTVGNIESLLQSI